MDTAVTVLIDWSSAEPVYAQIARQIRSRIASGDLAPGLVLPPVRGLASDLGVNLNTVARAYWLLEEEGFLKIRSRSGAEVTAPLRDADPATVERLRQQLAAALSRMRQAGLTHAEVRQQAEQELAALAGHEPER
jgi:DNA-binding transcriptional regulator YhcF (GntR family)